MGMINKCMFEVFKPGLLLFGKADIEQRRNTFISKKFC